MRPPESFSTAATNRRSHSCCVSLMVAVDSFITKTLSCAAAGGADDRTRLAARAAPTVNDTFDLVDMLDLPCAARVRAVRPPKTPAPAQALSFCAGCNAQKHD